MTPGAVPAPPWDPHRGEPENPVRAALGYWGVVATWMVVISLLSGEPFSAENTHRYLDPVLRYFFPHLTAAQFTFAHFVIRKSAHFTEFFILGSLAFWAARRGRAPGWRAAWMLQAIALAVAYSLVDELHQAFVPNRTASLTDSGIDSLGAVASQVVIYLRHLTRARFGLLHD
jgi:VanZ family protein